AQRDQRGVAHGCADVDEEGPRRVRTPEQQSHQGERNMKRRMLVVPLVGAIACSWMVAACGGGAAETRSDEKPKEKQAKNVDEEGDGPAPKMHGPKKRVGIVDFENASHYSWGHG